MLVGPGVETFALSVGVEDPVLQEVAVADEGPEAQDGFGSGDGPPAVVVRLASDPDGRLLLGLPLRAGAGSVLIQDLVAGEDLLQDVQLLIKGKSTNHWF